MVDIYFLESPRLVDPYLLRAIQGVDGFAEVHREYVRRYSTTYEKGFEWLAEDLKDADLPVFYSSYNSFRNVRDRKVGESSSPFSPILKSISEKWPSATPPT